MEKKRIAIFDIDGTIFRKNLHFELINELVWMKVFPREVRGDLTRLYTSWLEHKGTYEDYRVALVRLYEKHIAGKKKKDVIEASRIVVPFHKNRTYVFVEKLIEKLRKDNFCIIAISGSPLEIVEEFNLQHLRFEKVFGSTYKIDKKEIYTGAAEFEPTKDKGQVLRQYVFENNLTLEGSFGVGDTESDAGFLDLVDNPIAFNPNYNLKNIAEEKGWRIVVEKKDVIYEIR
ncbi:MAG: HAD-superfamily subfamily IB hydrolase, TIGR01490 [Candidatus Moranbacteria bacterium GW2011_GWE2_35_2-]|nr:MAG: HAD-superfamily subfamily IB hydrolase, TIGR01490 [Candidatus Moranbacteria bacterium GW2011_GWE2_35_2-]KKQ06768.1 MAG: HAD-superfamily subfamily IB hydrolase, TIGR01490 [Candidatus Moranbacteria bacterium GW2011_GWF1_36_4]KKQ22484.1 MAG: HAD-superfamily subfamily IB hydrolase, TIGR01490 [Candidatus Moranbacteria bacterium GW2011_GWF2_37_11]KKQ29553.1 MAG: HAD-superfamily subfamily IB hydrolase, TIGR01490 [Candidatus Moranbacteria bacterium GW2011_GWD1_37_17]KKQ30577.1 MAG: HAD-superfam